MTQAVPYQGAFEGIDVWETLRAAVLQRAPSASVVLERLRDADWRAVTPRERATIAVACALDMDVGTAGGRRLARQFLIGLENEGLVATVQGSLSVAEIPANTYADLKEDRRRALARDVEWVLREEFVSDIAALAGPVAVLSHVEKSTQLLRGQRGARFLSEIGFPIFIPDKARRRFLHRMGMLGEVAETRANRIAALQVLHGTVEQFGISPRELNYLLGVFTGGDVVEEKGAALCGVKPRCNDCPLGESCPWGRVQRQNSVRETPSPSLAEALLPEDRPREKLAQLGPQALTNAELLAIILRTGSDKEHAVNLANRLLRTAGSIERLSRFSVAELTTLPGLGPVKAITVKAALELARRLATTRPDDEKAISGARDVFERMRGQFLDRRKEYFVALLLNIKNKVTRQVNISEGTLNQSLVHPREAFTEAIKDSAASVIFVHNHPSGDPTPSRDDHVITDRLVRAGDIVGIKVLDHIIVGTDSYYSFADDGKLRD